MIMNTIFILIIPGYVEGFSLGLWYNPGDRTVTEEHSLETGVGREEGLHDGGGGHVRGQHGAVGGQAGVVAAVRLDTAGGQGRQTGESRLDLSRSLLVGHQEEILRVGLTHGVAFSRDPLK